MQWQKMARERDCRFWGGWKPSTGAGGLEGGRLWSEPAREQFKAICNQVLNRMAWNVSGHKCWGGGGAQRTECSVWIGEKSSAISVLIFTACMAPLVRDSRWQCRKWYLEAWKLDGSDLSEDIVSWVSIKAEWKIEGNMKMLLILPEKWVKLSVWCPVIYALPHTLPA